MDVRLEPLGRHHDRGAFDCGDVSVTRYLRTVALQAQEALRAATTVAVEPTAPGWILGFFTLVSIKVVDTELPDDLVRAFRIRNLASGAPAVLLAQLGVDRTTSKHGLGTLLLRQALSQACTGALAVGGVALIVDAINQEIAEWYRRRVPDFQPLTDSPLRLILPMRKIVAALIPSEHSE